MTTPYGAYTYRGEDARMLWYPNEPDPYGSPIGTPAGIVLDVVTENVMETRTEIQDRSIRPSKFRRKPKRGNKRVQGSVEMLAGMSMLGYILQTMLGAPTEKTATTPWELFRGAGLDDLTIGGTFTGSQLTEVLIKIAASGTPDTYAYSTDGGATWSTPASITAGPDAITAGITATWAATTGHTAGDIWVVYASKQIGFVFSPDFVANGAPPCFKLERQWEGMSPQRYLPYSGMRSKTLTIPLTEEWDGSIRLDVIGRNQETEDTNPLDATPTTLSDPWLGGATKMVMRNGVQVYDVTECQFKIDFPQMDPRIYPVGGGYMTRSLPISMMEVTAALKVSYESAALIQAARNLTNVDLGIWIRDDSSTIQTLHLRAAEGTLEQNVEATIQDGDLVLDYMWRAHYESSDWGTMIQAILDCGLATGSLDGPA